MPSQIWVNNESEFFIAICKFKCHSYVTVGVKQPNEGIHLLGGFGKYRYPGYFKCRPFFFKSEAFIKNEAILADEDDNGQVLLPGRNEVYYKAYGIKYQQYLQFLAYMAAISRSQRDRLLPNTTIPPKVYNLSAFVPIVQDGNDVQLELRVLDEQTYSRELGADEFSLQFFSNSCRHTSIRLMEVGRGVTGLGEGVSSSFVNDPPLEAFFGRGMVQKGHYFYILPLPPTSFPQIRGPKKEILIKLYNRLDKMILIEQDDQVSIDKFNGLKTLYQETAGREQDDILGVIESIEQWEESNQELIATHRSWYFFGMQTATQKMFNELHDQFEGIRNQSSASINKL